MSETDEPGSWAEFLSRIRQHTDMMLDQLRTVTSAKDADDKEARSLNNLILKSEKIWQNALAQDPRQQERRSEKSAPAVKRNKG